MGAVPSRCLTGCSARAVPSPWAPFLQGDRTPQPHLELGPVQDVLAQGDVALAPADLPSHFPTGGKKAQLSTG